MDKCYRAAKPEVVGIIEALLRTQELRVENAEAVIAAINIFARSKADFSACLIQRSCHMAGCQHTLTFDAAAAKTAGMRVVDEQFFEKRRERAGGKAAQKFSQV